MASPAPVTSADWIDRLLPADAHVFTRRLVDYWLAIHPDPRTLPGRRHFDPLGLPGAIWPHIGLTEPIYEPPFDMRYRLVGTALVENMGEECTGLTVRTRRAAFANRSVEQVLSHYRVVCMERRPDYASFPVMEQKRGYYVQAERIHLPMATNGRDVDLVLTSVVDRGPVAAPS